MPFGRRRARWIAAVCVTLAAVSAPVAGCSKDGSDTKQGAGQNAAKPTVPTSGTDGRQPTLGDYIKQNGITESQVKPGQSGIPTVSLPMGPGWADLGLAKPAYAYAAIINTDRAFKADPPSIVAVMSKLSGPVDPAQILALAPNEIRNLPNFSGSDPTPGKLSNFDSAQIAGTYTRDGKTRLIAQKTVVIPSGADVYVLQLNADGLTQQAQALAQATEAIDNQATIEVK
jgi:hypothetical protein